MKNCITLYIIERVAKAEEDRGFYFSQVTNPLGQKGPSPCSAHHTRGNSQFILI